MLCRLARLRRAAAAAERTRAMANALPRGVCAGASDPQAEPAPAAASAQASMDFPGGRVPFTPELKFVGGHFSADTPPMSCYRTVDSAGDALEEVLPFQYPASQSCSYGNTPRS
jgi:hypothetical protein